jgi:uncharacterized protein
VIVYVDTSAALKLLVEENESNAVADYLERCRRSQDTLIASLLLHSELHCAARRQRDLIDRDAVADVLQTIALVDVESGDLTTGPLLPGRLRSADAIHLATALRVDAHSIVCYDRELCWAADNAGIDVISPE